MVTKHCTFGALLLTFLTGCGRIEEQNSKLTKVIGTDDRVPASERHSDVIGSLSFGQFHVCSAYVSAPKIVSTALHCAPLGDNLDNYYFTTQSGKRFKLIKKISSHQNLISSFETAESTPAFLESAPFNPNLPIEAVYYSSNSKRYLSSTDPHAQITTQGLLHHLDTEHGSSGAPILQKGKVVAVHEGGLINAQQNFAIRVVSDSKQNDLSTGFIDQEWKCHSRCEWYQPDCYAWKELNCNTGIITVCGRNLAVPMIAYYACQVALGALPASCTAGAAATAGTSCAANIGIAAAACSVSIDQIYEIGKACSTNL